MPSEFPHILIIEHKDIKKCDLVKRCTAQIIQCFIHKHTVYVTLYTVSFGLEGSGLRPTPKLRVV